MLPEHSIVSRSAAGCAWVREKDLDFEFSDNFGRLSFFATLPDFDLGLLLPAGSWSFLLPRFEFSCIVVGSGYWYLLFSFQRLWLDYREL